MNEVPDQSLMRDSWMKLISSDASKAVELATRFGIALAASLYVTGILVVNMYYAQFGYYSLSLLRLDYILAGFWVLAVNMVGYFCMQLFYRGAVFELFNNRYNWGMRIFLALLFIVIIFLVLQIGYLIMMLIGCRPHLQWLWAIILGGTSFSLLLEAPKGKFPGHFGKYFERIAYFLTLRGIAIPIFFFAISSFSFDVLGDIPIALGGGRIQPVRLIAPPARLAELVQLGLAPTQQVRDSTSSNHAVLTDTLSLLSITENNLVFVLHGKREMAVSVRTDAIDGVIYIPESNQIAGAH